MLLIQIYKVLAIHILLIIVLAVYAAIVVSPVIISFIIDNWWFCAFEIITFPCAFWLGIITLTKLYHINNKMIIK